MYVHGNPSNRHLVWVDRQGRMTQLPGEADSILRATVSRDGKRVVYDGNESTEWMVDLTTGARTRIVSDVRSWHGGWLPGDDRIVVSSNKDGDWDLYRVGDVQTKGSLVLGTRRKLLDLSGYDAGVFREFDVSADGQRFLLIRTEPDSRPVRLDIILNWFDELRRLAGTR